MKNILIIGGTGRLGQMLSTRLVGKYSVTTLSRRASDADNHIQADVCEFDSYAGFDTVIHCAAMKDVVKCETMIEECVRTNVTGTAVALRNAARSGVERYIYISTDMAVEPQSVYGASKKIADAMVVEAARNERMQTAVIRLGNIIAKDGSILTVLAQKARELGYVPVTDPCMTRFLMSSQDCADFVIGVACRESLRGEIFVPKCPSYRIMDVAQAVAPGIPIRVVGMRPGDMLTVTMVAQAEAHRAVDEGDVIKIIPIWSDSIAEGLSRLNSANNSFFATVDQLRELYESLVAKK